MNRENKRRRYEKGYYRNHACNDSFTCKVCGKTFIAGQGKKLILCNKCRKNRDN